MHRAADAVTLVHMGICTEKWLADLLSYDCITFHEAPNEPPPPFAEPQMYRAPAQSCCWMQEHTLWI